MKKVLMLASVASMIDQFNMSNIKILQKMGCKVYVVANFHNGSTTSKERVITFKDELKKIGVTVFDIGIERNVLSIKNFIAFRQIKRIINHEQFDLIHCHSPIGGVLARLAARNARKIKTRVIYTAHGFHFFKGAPLRNWFIYYIIELWLARITDLLITINKEDYLIAQKTFKANKISYIPGIGVNTEKIRQIQFDKQDKLRELGLPNEAFIILSVGELNKNKNHEKVIRAIASLGNPNVYYIICGQGSLESYLNTLISELKLERQIRLLGYRKDVAEIYKVANIFAFPSYREGLSVSLMEAMASGLPVICSNIRGNNDLIENGKGGFLVEPENISGFTTAIQRLIADPSLRGIMETTNLSSIKNFDQKKVNSKMSIIYKELLS